jgi:hypothetical protein
MEGAYGVGVFFVEAIEDIVYAIGRNGVVAFGEFRGALTGNPHVRRGTGTWGTRSGFGRSALAATDAFCAGLFAELGWLAGKLSFGHEVSGISWTDYNVLYSTTNCGDEHGV